MRKLIWTNITLLSMVTCGGWNPLFSQPPSSQLTPRVATHCNTRVVELFSGGKLQGRFSTSELRSPQGVAASLLDRLEHLGLNATIGQDDPKHVHIEPIGDENRSLLDQILTEAYLRKYAPQWSSHHLDQPFAGKFSQFLVACPDCGPEPFEVVSLPDLGADEDQSYPGPSKFDCGTTPIAIVDTGLNTAELSLVSTPLPAGFKIPGNIDASTKSHGSLMARIIAHQAKGLCKEAAIVSVQVLQKSDEPEEHCATHGLIADGLRHVLNNGTIKIINFSIAMRFTSDEVRAAFEELEKKGILVIAAAGNDGQKIASAAVDGDHSYPISYKLSNVIGVAGTQVDSMGKECYLPASNFSKETVMLAALSESRLSTAPGTSIAAAKVSAAALHLMQTPTSIDQIKEGLLKASVEVGCPPRKTQSSRRVEPRCFTNSALCPLP